jgi:hypothetical protein
MSFSFPSMSEEEIQALNMVEDGIYDFQVVKATQKVSKSGNQMIELQLVIWDKDGKEHIVFDYLVSIVSMVYKIKHFCDTVGLDDEYKAGNFDVMQCEGKRGKAHIIVQAGQPNPNGGMYADKNAVRDYVLDDKGSVKVDLSGKKSPEPKDENSLVDDDIPF